MDTFVFDSEDLAATEAMLNSAYTKMRIGSSHERTRAQVAREVMGTVSVDQLDLEFDMAYRADPLGRVCVCDMQTGAIEETFADGSTDTFVPGDLALIAPPDEPYSGVVRSARYRLTMFDPALFTQVASAARGRGVEPVRLTHHRPVSDTAVAELRQVVRWLREHVLAVPEARESSLIAASAQQCLAASVLRAFPNTATPEPTAVDRRDAHPDTVRRAIAYIEAHATEPISVADIAAGAHVTIRAIQLAFRKHLDTTPMGYLRKVRLAGAHEQLLAASPDDGHTVTGVAAAWGFAHPGRFASSYRQAYGVAPQTTLHD
ncbi:Helix-turn-helix domain-containing protein [Nocardia amikacinitolerans]|uniref:Helix-turn-helix domain-containing protein n=1 Tax=Nocardia amikacinitolerans TaxID=756689 RepID=A0A285KT51_9NOCA|nr:helix-turn-helix domain-containing protein [Nocardia amikacinitolerans]MCP2275412.1 Helix-turn-helix domain-containing protein [Nocardia amikacinitolerans]SNY74441.1 Helix-turn-helix domain-containing protein [Nocardia amikacinitolerans]